jgi:flagellar biosynthesis/type III secretory pathway protein FliH
MGLARSTEQEHRYQFCADEHCPRFPCRVYKEGFQDGHRRGFDEGYAKGYPDGYNDGYRKGWQEGYDKGFPDGIAACPRPHK